MVGGKREIEAVYDTWENGIVGYLYHKLSYVLELEGEVDEIDSMELQDMNVEIMGEDEMPIEVKDTVDDYHRKESIDEWDDDIFLLDGYESIGGIHLDGADGDDAEICFESMQDDDLLNI